jgi:hypothetical protein
MGRRKRTKQPNFRTMEIKKWGKEKKETIIPQKIKARRQQKFQIRGTQKEKGGNRQIQKNMRAKLGKESSWKGECSMNRFHGGGQRFKFQIHFSNLKISFFFLASSRLPLFTPMPKFIFIVKACDFRGSYL